MPGIGVRELVAGMLSLRPEMKVLLMSGYTDEAIVRHGILEAGNAFIQKPFTPNSLSLKVREVLDSVRKQAGQGFEDSKGNSNSPKNKNQQSGS
jgi:two-component system, cell cycle sensor histidine kinase and response regulator CckA